MEQNPHQKSFISNIHLKKRISIILEKKWKVLTIVLGGGLLALLISFILPKKYKSTALIRFNYNSVNSALISNPGSFSNEIALIKSDQVLNSAKNSLADKGINISIQELIEDVDVKEDNSSSTFTVSGFSDEAKKTEEITNAISRNFYEDCLLKNRNSYLFLVTTLNERDRQLQENLKSGLSSSPLSSSNSIPASDDKIIAQISEFESELEGIELDNQFYSMKLNEIEKIIDKNFSQVSSSIEEISNAPFLELKQKIERIEIQNNLLPTLQKLRGFEINYPWGNSYDIKQLDTYKSNFYSQLTSIVKDIAAKNNIVEKEFLQKLAHHFYENQIKVNSYEQTKSIIFNTMTSLEDKFNRIPFELLESAREVRSKRFINNLGFKIKSKLLRVKETESKYLAFPESIQLAEVPSSFISPNIVLNTLLGLLLGLIVGLGKVLLSKGQDLDVINSVEELEESGYKIIAQIAHFPSTSPVLFDPTTQSGFSELEPKIIHSFDNIQTFLKYGNLDKPLKTVLITSGYNEEGKSTVAANIALALANNKNKVLLVDADLIKPDLNKIFKIKATPSLAHYLFRKKELGEIVHKTYNQNLDLITCIEFPQNPSVIITSERMKNFMEIVEKEYDYVIYDSSSLCSLKETSFIGKNVDEVILVVRANKTKFTEFSDAEILLNENGISDFDVIFNDA